jgi:phosphatidylserine/phosphatidylglycerophosphate/cardiolipin synthase-like enzyme
MTCGTDEIAVAGLPHVPVPIPKGGTETARQDVLRWYPRNYPVTFGNAVVAYAYGVCAFSDIGDALATATRPDHRIYLLGWGTDVDTVLRPGRTPRTLGGLLTASRAQIRALFWNNPLKPMDPGSGSNITADKFINQLPNGASVLDDKLPEVQGFGVSRGRKGGGVHHQKLLIVYGSQGLIAFAGGMDLNPSRLFTGVGDVNNPLHDVHVRVAGEAGLHLLKVFSDRWLDLGPATAEPDQRVFGTSRQQVKTDFARLKAPPAATARTLPSSTGRPRNGAVAVAVGRTFAPLSAYTAAKASYGFAGNGEHTAWDLVEAGISAAREYIYIEDQYFLSTRLRKLLAAKLAEPQFKFLLVLAAPAAVFEQSPELFVTDPNTHETSIPNEIPYAIGARNDIKAELATADPARTRWRIFDLVAAPDAERAKACGAYLHSKTMIIDDRYVLTGSCNANDRGYTFDTEIVLGLTDDPGGRAAGQRFARDLRVNLWHKHLGVPHAEVATWARGLPRWLRPPRSAMVRDASGLEDSPMLGPKARLSANSRATFTWRESIDPDAYARPPVP